MYMGLDSNNRPNGWDTEPWGNSMLVDDTVYQTASQHPDWTWDGTALVAPPIPVPPTLDEVKATQKNIIAASRYAAETAGVVVNGAIIRTDRESQATLTGAYVRVQQAPTALIDWKAETGWVQIDKATVEALCDAVGAHVQGCFTREKDLSTAIDACTTIADVEVIAW